MWLTFIHVAYNAGVQLCSFQTLQAKSRILAGSGHRTSCHVRLAKNGYSYFLQCVFLLFKWVPSASLRVQKQLHANGKNKSKSKNIWQHNMVHPTGG